MADDKQLYDFAQKHGLEIEAASVIEARKFAVVRGVNFVEIFKFRWPKVRSRTRYDQSVYIGLFDDGSFQAMITVNDDYFEKR